MDAQEGAELGRGRIARNESGNRGLDFGIAAYPHDDRLYPERPGGSLDGPGDIFRRRVRSRD